MKDTEVCVSPYPHCEFGFAKFFKNVPSALLFHL